MPRTGAIYTLPPSYRATTGETIQPSQHNPPLEDLAQAVTNSLARNGAGGMTGTLIMNNNRVAGVAAPIGATDAATKNYVDTAVDPSKVVHTSGVQTISGRKTFADFPVMSYPAVKMRFTEGAREIDIRQGSLFGFYSVGSQAWMMYFDGTDTLNVPGGISATGGISGPGQFLTNLNASAVTSGTLDDARLPSTAARTATTITAGNGLSGGGNLMASRTVSLGTPSSITKDSANSVTGSSHTHSLSATDFRDMMSSWLRINIIGTSCLLRVNAGVVVGPNQVIPASSFAGFTNTSGEAAVSTPVGTWVCLGYAGGTSNADRTSLFMRIT